MDVAELRRNLDALAGEEALSSRRGVLTQLSAALGTDDAHHWSRVDLFALFPLGSVDVPAHGDLIRRAARVEWARNVLILAPLLITWVGIAIATNRYGALLEESPELGRQPFIQLWESGFEGTSIRFSTIGMLDVAAITAVIILTIWLGRLRAKIEVEVADREREIWNQLQAVLASVTVALARIAFDSPVRISEALGKAVGDLTSVTGTVSGTSSSVTALLSAASETVSQFSQGQTDLAAGTASIAASTSAIESASSALVASFGSMETRLDGVVDGVTKVADANQSLAGQVSASLAASTRATDEMTSAAAGVRNVALQLEQERAAQVDAGTALAGSAREITASAGAIASYAKSYDTTSARLVDAGDAVSAAAGSLNDVARNVDKAFGDDLGSLPGRLGSIATSFSDASERATAATAAAATELARATAELRAVIQSSADSLDRAARSLEAVAQSGGGRRQRGSRRKGQR